MTAPSTTTDVLIVGAGPTGLTLACDLARCGVAHHIIDRAEAHSTASRAKTIMPRSLEVADDLGMVSRILDRGRIGLPARYYSADGAAVDRPGVAVGVTADRGTPYPDPVWIAEFDVEDALRDRHARLGGRVELATTATGLDQDRDGVTVTVDTAWGARTVRARYVVGADGGRSSVRRLVGAPLVGSTDDTQRWYLGDVRLRGLDRDRMHVWFSAEGMLGLTPLPSTDIWQLQATIPADVEEPEAPSLGLYRAMLARRPGAEDVRVTDASWLSVYRVNVRMVERYRHGRVLLAGDAAHVHSPAGGQGMNTGMQDAHNLGWKLAAVLAGAGSALLDTYDEERRPVARAVLEDSTRRLGAVMATVAGHGSSAPSLGTISDDLTSGLLVSYPTSSLSLPAAGGPGDGPRAGDRAPDATGLRGDHVGSLFELFRGPHWTLLAFTDGPVPPPPVDGVALRVHRIARRGPSGVVDAAGDAHRAYAARDGELVLVRPDGYIATRQAAGDAQLVADHLHRHLRSVAPSESLSHLSRRYAAAGRAGGPSDGDVEKPRPAPSPG